MSKLKIDYVDINIIKPYEKNTKIHSQDEISQLARIIDEFGFDVPIVVDKDYVIIKGHKRRLAEIERGSDKVPIIVRDDLTNDQIRAARIADNKVSESEWDYEMLKLELETLDNFDLDLTGFNEKEISEILEEQNSEIFGALESNVFANAVNGNSDEFQVTFVFDKKYKDAWEKGLADNGKDYYRDMIIQSISEAEDA
jgi:hypothetical protein